jgi:hypothetical protein
MQYLLTRLQTRGLSEQQSERVLRVLHHWLQANYPVMGVVSKQFLASQTIKEECEQAFEWPLTYVEEDLAVN